MKCCLLNCDKGRRSPSLREIVKRLNLHEGDQFEVIEKDGGIFLCPVVVYPREKMQEIAKIFKEAKEDDTLKEYDSVERCSRIWALIWMKYRLKPTKVFQKNSNG